MSQVVCTCDECGREHDSLETLRAPWGQDEPAWDIANGQLIQGWLCSCDEWIDVVMAEDALIGPGVASVEPARAEARVA